MIMMRSFIVPPHSYCQAFYDASCQRESGSGGHCGLSRHTMQRSIIHLLATRSHAEIPCARFRRHVAVLQDECLLSTPDRWWQAVTASQLVQVKYNCC